jgi:hypothetical protein
VPKDVITVPKDVINISHLFQLAIITNPLSAAGGFALQL